MLLKLRYVILWDYYPNWAPYVEIEDSKAKRFLTHLTPFRSFHGISFPLIFKKPSFISRQHVILHVKLLSGLHFIYIPQECSMFLSVLLSPIAYKSS